MYEDVGLRAPDADALLTHKEFERAVRDAMRHCNQVDLLTGNALLRARLFAPSEQEIDNPEALRSLLVETASTLFTGERDKRIYRVLELTYFNPAPKQEAAAERLGLSFSTYRRYLASGVGRLVEWLWQREQQAQNTETAVGASLSAASRTMNSVRPRLSIVILPFLNLSHENSVDYLVDGVVDSLITDLSNCLQGSIVIPRSTAFTYKGRAVPIRQIGEELGVRYVLEGSMQVDAHHVRVNVQLIDAESNTPLWAERFDKERRELLQVQDEIVGRLSRSVGIELIRREAERPAATGRGLDAVDLVMRARALIYDAGRKEHATQAIDLFRRALELDSDCLDAMVGIALVRIFQVINLYRLVGREVLLDEAEDMIAHAASLAPNHFAMLGARALLLRARGRFQEAVVATEGLIARNPAEPTAYKEMGLNKLYLGQTKEAVEWFRRADSIAPRDPARWTWLQGLGRALMQLGDAAGAVEALSQALDSNPNFISGTALLAAAEALTGNIRIARRYLAEYAASEPRMTIRRFAQQRSSVPPGAVSLIYHSENEQILDGLRRAGMPD
jgi:adenylate cyclase